MPMFTAEIDDVPLYAPTTVLLYIPYSVLPMPFVKSVKLDTL